MVETFPNNHANVEDFKRTLKFATLYAKTVTLGRTHWPVTNRVMLRNRRIGCSMSGIAQLIASRGALRMQAETMYGARALRTYIIAQHIVLTWNHPQAWSELGT